MGKYTPTGRMQSELREQPAVYPAFARLATRGTHCLRHSITYSSHELPGVHMVVLPWPPVINRL